MQTFSKEISDALQFRGQCLLPGVGLLRILRSHAEKSYQENKLLPPSHEIVLEPAPRNTSPDISVTGWIAAARGISGEEAGQLWNETVILIKEKLSTGSSVELEGLGLLNIGEEGEIVFAGTHVAYPLYPPHSLDALAASRKPATPLPAEKEPEQELVPDAVIPTGSPETEPAFPGAAKARPKWWIIGSILVLLAVGWFTYKGTMQRKRKARHIATILHESNGPASAQMAFRDSMALEADSMRDSLPQDDSIRYHIVIAEYQNLDKALRQYKKMRDWGHPVELRTLDSVTYKLAYPYTSLPGDTTVNLVNMMKLYGGKAHIEYDLDR